MSRGLFLKTAAPLGAGAAIVLAGLVLAVESQEKTRKFTLVYNVNNGGYVDVCGCKHKEVRQGSITRRASFLKQLRATGREILLLDGGSALFAIHETPKPAEVPEAVRKAELIVEAYNRMGYRAMAVGPYDIITGLDTLKALEKKAKFRFLSANFADAEGKLHFEPHASFEVGGVRVGVIGLTLDTIPKPILDAKAPGSRITDPFEAASRSYAALTEKTDLIVALSHLREDNNFELIKRLKGLEVLVDPYIEYGSHKTWLKDESEWLTERDGTLFLRSDGQGARMGVVDIELAKPRAALASGFRRDELRELVEFGEATEDERRELAALEERSLYRFTRISLEPHHLTDPEIDTLIDAWKKKIDPSSVRHLEAGLPERESYLTHLACKPCHEKQYEWWKGTAHAHALETLKKTADHLRYDCVGCHTLGYGQAYLDTSTVGAFADVQCESCHGLKPEHVKDPKAHPFGRTERAACIVCHNKEQTRVDFPYARAKRKVACPSG